MLVHCALVRSVIYRPQNSRFLGDPSTSLSFTWNYFKLVLKMIVLPDGLTSLLRSLGHLLGVQSLPGRAFQQVCLLSSFGEPSRWSCCRETLATRSRTSSRSARARPASCASRPTARTAARWPSRRWTCVNSSGANCSSTRSATATFLTTVSTAARRFILTCTNAVEKKLCETRAKVVEFCLDYF